jgi:histidinol phosphatase-like PHP family hydrolase
MKPEYKMRVQEHLEAIAKRNKVIAEMLSGERPANQAEAIKLSKEIERLLELTTNIVDLS